MKNSDSMCHCTLWPKTLNWFQDLSRNVLYSRTKLMRYTWSVSAYFLLYTLCSLWITGYSVPLVQPYQLSVSGVSVSCLTDKCPSDAPSALRHTSNRGSLNGWGKKREKDTLIIAFRKTIKNSQCYSRCWKFTLLIEHSWGNCGRFCLLSSSLLEVIEISWRMFCFNLESIRCHCLTTRSQW